MKNYDYKYNFIPISEELTQFETKLLRLEQVRYIENPNEFFKETAYLKEVDQKSTYYYTYSNIKSRNFTPGSGYLTHGFDFYQGSFHGQMVRGLINYCNLDKNSTILDPFCGSGTTLIESKLLGFDSIGIDINPIACLNTKVKTALLDSSIDYLLSNNDHYLDLNYYKTILPIKGTFDRFLNDDFKELFYTFLYTRAISDEVYISKRRDIAFQDNLKNVITTLSKFEDIKKKMIIELGEAKVFFNNALEQLKLLKSHSIDAIITSPPYIDLIDYIENDKYQIACLLTWDFIKLLKKKSIGRKYDYFNLTEKLYWYEMDLFFKEISRILKINKNFILVINNFKNMRSKFIDFAKKNGFSIELILKREVVNLRSTNKVEYVFFMKNLA